MNDKRFTVLFYSRKQVIRFYKWRFWKWFSVPLEKNKPFLGEARGNIKATEFLPERIIYE